MDGDDGFDDWGGFEDGNQKQEDMQAPEKEEDDDWADFAQADGEQADD